MRLLTNSFGRTARSVGRSSRSIYPASSLRTSCAESCSRPHNPSLLPAAASASISLSHNQNQHEQRRGIMSMFKKRNPNKVPEPNFPWVPDYLEEPRKEVKKETKIPILAQDNLFHPFSQSPIPAIRAMAKRIQHNAPCPHNVTHNVGQHELKFECPDCGVPVYCSEEHWQADYHNHVLVCDTLREINEDTHDILSEREFPEFDFAPEGWDDEMINLLNWDTFLYTRQFPAHDSERSLRHATKLLTYPITIGTVLSELSPYNLKNGRLTYEGLKSFSATRYSLHPTPSGAGREIKDSKPLPPPMRIFVVGARAEASLPRNVWCQLPYMFPNVSFHVIFCGPEAFQNRPLSLPWPPPPRSPENPFGQLIERPMHRLKLATFTEYFHTIHKTGYWRPYDPYFDVFMLFHPGLGDAGSSKDWVDTLPMLLETKCPIIATGYSENDMEKDVKWVKEQSKGEVDILLEPGENIFKSLKWDINELDPSGDLSQGNWGVWAFRGKRYETSKYIETPDVINM